MCLHQVGGGDGGFLSQSALGKGLGWQPHGQSEEAQLGPLCPRSKDTRVTLRTLSYGGSAVRDLFLLNLHSACTFSWNVFKYFNQ